MKISVPAQDNQVDAVIFDQLQRFINQPEPSVSPPCGGCNNHMKNSCNPSCAQAAGALSVDPVRHPIEPKAVPMVFEISATRLMQTCWSCEGHIGADDKLWKIPQVCFYSSSPVYPKLVLIHVSRLYSDKALHYRWQIVLSEFSQRLELTYSIQPDLNRINDPHLGKLQSDLVTLSKDMHSELKIIAKDLLTKYNKPN